MNKSCVTAVLCLFFVLLGASDYRGRSIAPGENPCSGLVEERFARIGSRLGNTWDVLGILRSITIKPAYRARFLESVVDDAIVVLDEVAQLSAYCTVCSGRCSRFLTAFEDVGERFAGVTEAFHAVCVPTSGGEERVLGELIARAAQHFNNCWETALKVDAASKTDL